MIVVEGIREQTDLFSFVNHVFEFCHPSECSIWDIVFVSVPFMYADVVVVCRTSIINKIKPDSEIRVLKVDFSLFF